MHAGRRELLTDFAPAFEYAVRYGGARGIMAAYHELDGVPSCANEYTLTELLRDDFNFKGYVLADDGAVSMMLKVHGTAADPADAIVQYLTAGGNVEYYDFDHETWVQSIVESVHNGTLPLSVLDARVADILRVKTELGLFDSPLIDPSRIASTVNSPEARALALRAAQEAVVLLTNVNSTLPLDLRGRRLAVVGPSADVVRVGDYAGGSISSNFNTPLEGLVSRATAAGATLTFAPGCGGVPGETAPVRPRYLSQPGGGPLVGNYFDSVFPGSPPGAPNFTREDGDINRLWYAYSPAAYDPTPLASGAPFYTRDFTVIYDGLLTAPIGPPAGTAGATLSVQTSGDPFRLVIRGAVVIDTYATPTAPTTVAVSLTAGEPVPFTLQYSRVGSSNDAGISLQWSLVGSPADGEDAAIAAAAAAAAAADVVVAFLGETTETVGEGVDSNTLALPGRQADLFAALVATGKPVVVVLVHGRPLAIPYIAAHASAVVSAAFLGQAAGEAIAGALVGDFSPAGRTPFTWPQSVGDLPVYYNMHKSATRIFYHVSQTGQKQCDAPIWAFGAGLSYASFTYSGLVVAPASVPATASVTINVTVTNTAAFVADEVVQLYVQDVVSSVATPAKQLKAFERVTLGAGASTVVSFELVPARDLYVIARFYSRVVEPGQFIFWVSQASDKPVVNGTFSIVGGALSVAMGAFVE